jgi:hypothetical protein
MSHILKNKNLQIQIDLPFENYDSSRFDWTGKISKVSFQGIELSGKERTDSLNMNHLGQGFYNEFGIDRPLGFGEVDIGDWFHKIGIGALKKESSDYSFTKTYEIEPAEFSAVSEPESITINCRSKVLHDYAYLLRKEIRLSENGFSIGYRLENNGTKHIVTNEYLHNFMAMDNRPIDHNYILKFPFQLRPDLFIETVNPEGKVCIGEQDVRFKGTPEEQFFFSNLSGDDRVKASWELIDQQKKIGIREVGSFQTDRVNLWGWKQVISPELFFEINLKPGQSVEWKRNFIIFRIK